MKKLLLLVCLALFLASLLPGIAAGSESIG